MLKIPLLESLRLSWKHWLKLATLYYPIWISFFTFFPITCKAILELLLTQAIKIDAIALQLLRNSVIIKFVVRNILIVLR